MTPNLDLCGQDPPFLFKGAVITSLVEEVNQQTQQWDEILKELWDNLVKVQYRKSQADKHRRDVQYQKILVVINS